MLTRFLAVLMLAAGVTLCAGADAPPATFASQVKSRFAAWDRNKDGVLSREEIDSLVSDARIRGTEAAAVAALKRALRATRYKSPPLTAEWLTKQASEKPLAKRSPDLNKMYATAYGRIQKGSRELFPAGGPDLISFHQGKLGNCFCLAAVGSMVSARPDDVRNRITRMADGTYQVRFGISTVRVPAPTDAERALLASTGPGGLWVNVYEKAVGKLRVERRKTAGPESYIDLLGKGGSAGTAMSVLTGNEIVRFGCKQVRNAKTAVEKEAKLASAREQLVAAFVEKRLVTCGTGPNVKVPGVHGGHAYAVTGYDRKTDRIALWNPHGQTFTPKGTEGLANGYSTKGGRFTMPLTEFMQTFAGLAFETGIPTGK